MNCKYNIDILSRQKEQLVSSLRSRLSTDEWARVSCFIEGAQAEAFNVNKSRQQAKYEKLSVKPETERLISDQQRDKIQEKWVHNISDKQLSPDAVSLLKHGLNYAITPKSLPREDIIVATELACRNLSPETSASLRSEVASTIINAPKIKQNVTENELKALQQLKEDESIMILPADKGKSTVVMNKSDYKSKISALLSDRKTYEVLKSDPTGYYKRKLIDKLKSIKREGNISDKLYNFMYPTSEEVPKLYGLPKIHKQGAPLRPIVSSVGSVTYNTAKHLAVILNSVKGKNGYAVKNAEDFSNKVRNKIIPPGYEHASFDVTSLFTCIPVDYALRVIRKKLMNDDSWKKVTELTLDNVMDLLEFCLTTTYFVYDGVFYRQCFGAPMGAPISPGVADLTMEDFEEEALDKCPPEMKPTFWVRYVDDIYTHILSLLSEEFHTHLNSQNENIQFTKESAVNMQIPFLDALSTQEDDGHVSTKVYRKPTHTDQYLNWNSNHHLQHKRSVVRSLLRRADKIVTSEEDKKVEKQHISRVLAANGYQKWALTLPPPKKQRTEPTENRAPSAEKKHPVALPYVQGVSEKLHRIFTKHGAPAYHKPYNTLKSLLVHPKDQSEIHRKCNTVYSMKCDDCDKEYIGETGRTVGIRHKEHTDGKHNSAIHDHMKATGHLCSMDNVKVLDREDNYWARKYRESIHIHKRRPALNRDRGIEIPPIMLKLVTPRARAHAHSNLLRPPCGRCDQGHGMVETSS